MIISTEQSGPPIGPVPVVELPRDIKGIAAELALDLCGDIV
jgi:hypothetical protein